MKVSQQMQYIMLWIELKKPLKITDGSSPLPRYRGSLQLVKYRSNDTKTQHGVDEITMNWVEKMPYHRDICHYNVWKGSWQKS